MSSRWVELVEAFHERVRVACWEPLAERLVQLHQPRFAAETAVCRGCDGGEPVWPCRTYATLAAAVLDHADIETAFVRALEPGPAVVGVLTAVTRSR